MKLLFCESEINRNNVDEAFLDEYVSALDNGFSTLFYNFEEKSTQKIIRNEKAENLVYRGWMLKPELYEKLYYELLEKNYKLINNPKEYKNCHYLPENLQFINNLTPKTIFQRIENEKSIDILIEKANIFDGKPVIIKDYVKSEKHYWNTACFVNDSLDKKCLKDSILNLLDIRGESFNEGIVIREYIELNQLTKHSKSGMPISEEYRLFFLNNELFSIYNYWEEGNYQDNNLNIDKFKEIAKTIKSNFFTMDIAREKNGNLIIMELGDGQVSAIPKNEDKNYFYKKLKNILEMQTSA